MKRTILTLLLVFVATTMFGQMVGQIPQKLSYQAVVRNASNELVSNQDIGIRISILQGDPDGTAVYTETQNAITNANGLLSIKIGDGITSDDFDAIQWHAGMFYVKTEIDTYGGTNYTMTGISQLLTVPFAFHSETATSALNVNLEGTEPVFLGWDKDASDDFDGEFLSLLNIPEDLADGDDVLTEEEVLAFVDADGYMKEVPENYINGSMIAMGADEPGDIMYYDGTNYVRLPKGVDNQALKMNNGLPKWMTVSSGMPDQTDHAGKFLKTDGTNANWEHLPPKYVNGEMIGMGEDAIGDIMYYDGTNYVRLPKGEENQVLIIEDNVPTWKTVDGISNHIITHFTRWSDYVHSSSPSIIITSGFIVDEYGSMEDASNNAHHTKIADYNGKLKRVTVTVFDSNGDPPPGVTDLSLHIDYNETPVSTSTNDITAYGATYSFDFQDAYFNQNDALCIVMNRANANYMKMYISFEWQYIVDIQ